MGLMKRLQRAGDIRRASPALGDALNSARLARKREGALEIEVEGSGFKAGDTVRGTVRATSPFDAQKLEACLRYKCSSRDTSAAALQGEKVLLHEGAVSGGESWPFELKIRADARPNFEVPDKKLRFEWAASVDHTGPDGELVPELELLGPVTPGPSVVDSSPGETVRGKKLDVAITPSVKEARLGDTVSADFQVGRVDGELEAGLVCTLNWEESVATGEDSYGWADKTEDRYEEWRPLTASGTEAFQIPADGLMSIRNKEAGITWEIRARQKKRLGRDPVTAAAVRVLH